MDAASTSLTILYATAELAPWSAVGGLGAVSASLPRALAAQGVKITVLAPMTPAIRRDRAASCHHIASVSMSFAHEMRAFEVYEDPETSEGLRLLFLVAPDFFETEEKLYGDHRGEMGVGHLRWLFFAAALRPSVRALDTPFDVIHVHDWHGALGPALDRSDHHFDDDAAACAWVLTIHNGAHLGLVARSDWREAGLRDDLIHSELSLIDGAPSLLKLGTVMADGISTVSPNYAAELIHQDSDHPLRDTLEARGDAFRGILNGIDTTHWDPRNDPYLLVPYDAQDLDNKDRNRTALLSEMGIDADATTILLGVVARLADQKGIDLLVRCAPGLIQNEGASIVILGQGEAAIEESLRDLARRHPRRVALRFAFDVGLSHRIEAGADIFVMPSRFEPCGLNQMISQRYGTPPVAHRTGGLADSINDDDPTRRTGFLFDDADATSLGEALREAMAVAQDRAAWRELQSRMMDEDVSWDDRAPHYVALYRAAMVVRSARDRDEFLDDLQLEPREPFLAPQRAIPSHYDIDRLVLRAVDPGQLWVSWEVQGPSACEQLNALNDDERYRSRWELRFEETASHARWTVEVDGMAKNWFVDVQAKRSYRAELWMSVEGRDDVLMVSSACVETPPEMSS